MTIDQKQAIEFLRILTRESKTAVTFQTFDDKKARKDPFLSGHSHGALPGDMYKHLKQRHGKGAGVFVMINEGDGKGRKAENVISVRALFLDTDGAPMEPARDALKPHIIVESSPGNFHLYWLVSDCEMDEFGRLQKAIAVKFGGDASVHDLPRVMRLPGFYHQKGDPVMTRLIKADDFKDYRIRDVIEGLELATEVPTKFQPRLKPKTTDTATGRSHEVVDPATGEVVDLCKWAVRCPDFRVAAALRKYAPQVLKGPVQDGKQHIICPFDNEHTDPGGNGTYVVDGVVAKKTKGFVIHCCHAHCTDRDRLDYIREMLTKGWFPFEALTDPDFLAGERRPPKVYYPGSEFQRHPGFLQLSPAERGLFTYLFMHVGCFIEEGGSVPDNPRSICRHLGIPEVEWGQFRELFLEVGLCSIDGDRIVCDLIANEDISATKAYNSAIRKARAGGSKTQQDKHQLEAPA